MKKIYIILLIIFISAFFIRLYPATKYDIPLRYDSYYHARVADLVKETGSIPSYEPWPYGGRPHVYPPGYHLIIAGLSSAFQTSSLQFTRFFLPIFSALTVLSVFWLVRKFRDDKTALMSSFFIALSAYIISTAYDSPQVLNIFIASFIIYYFLKEKYFVASIFLGVTYLLDPFSSLFIMLPLVVFLIIDKPLKKAFGKMFKLFSLPAAVIIIWYLSRYALLYCSDITLGTYFIGIAVSGLMSLQAFVIISTIVISLALLKKIEDSFQKFFLIWTIISVLLFLSYIFTSFFHPWRQSILISFAFSIFLPTVLVQLNKNRKILFSLLFIFIWTAGLIFLFYNVGLSPPLSKNEYTMLNWTEINLDSDSIILAHHDICAAMFTFTNRQCLLDISFECIENKTAFYDYENFFWLERSSEVKALLDEYPMTHIIYASNQWNNKVIEELSVNKIYSSWYCRDERCTKEAVIYEKSKRPLIIRIDDVWATENNSLSEWGYEFDGFTALTDAISDTKLKVILGVTPYIYDESCNCTHNISSDQRMFDKIMELKDEGYEIALHGVTHKCTEHGCEFENLTIEEDVEMINDSKNYLESIFETNINYFIPPKQVIDTNLSIALDILNMKNLDVFSTYTPIQRWLWEEKTVEWKGFNDFSDEDVVVIHYNIMDQTRLLEFEDFLTK